MWQCLSIHLLDCLFYSPKMPRMSHSEHVFLVEECLYLDRTETSLCIPFALNFDSKNSMNPKTCSRIRLWTNGFFSLESIIFSMHVLKNMRNEHQNQYLFFDNYSKWNFYPKTKLVGPMLTKQNIWNISHVNSYFRIHLPPAICNNVNRFVR